MNAKHIAKLATEQISRISNCGKSAFIKIAFTLIAVILSAQSANAQTPPTITPGTGLYFPGPSITMTADDGDTIYYTLDGSQPTTSSQVFSAAFTVSATATVNAIAVDGGGSSSVVSSAFINVDPTIQMLPSDTAPMLWLRSDTGVTTSSGTVSSWLDVSNNGNTATQTSSGNQPLFVNNDWNDYNGISFSSSGSQFLNLPSDFAALDSGAAFFIVTNPPWYTNGVLIDLGNGSNSDNLTVSDSGYTPTFTISEDSTPTSITAPIVTNGQYQLLEAYQYGSDDPEGELLVNGGESYYSSLPGANNITRTINHIGSDYSGAANFYDGDFLEMLVYNGSGSIGVPNQEYTQVENYLITRYQLLNAVPEDPIISLPTSTLTAPAQVAMSVPPGCTCYYTTDGSTPYPGYGQIYSGQPLTVSYSQTVQAISVKNNVQSADVVSSTFTLDSTQWPAPDPDDTTQLQFNVQSPAN